MSTRRTYLASMIVEVLIVAENEIEAEQFAREIALADELSNLMYEDRPHVELATRLPDGWDERVPVYQDDASEKEITAGEALALNREEVEP